MKFSELIMGGSITTTKSNIKLENIDQVVFDRYGHYRVRGYVNVTPTSPMATWQERWTTIVPEDLVLSA